MGKTGNKNNKPSKLKSWIIGGALALSGLVGINYTAKAQTPEEAFEYVAYPFSRPTTSQPTGPIENLNWYGSGDVDKNNIVNQADVNRRDSLIKGTFTDPDDIRLYDRADVNGDGFVNSQDNTIQQEVLNGTRAYLPGDWNKMQTRAEQEDWLQKIVNIAKLNETCDEPTPGRECDCTEFAEAGLIKLHGVSERDFNEFLKFDPLYEKFRKDNGRFNLPVSLLDVTDYLSDGNLGGHAYNTIVMGENALFHSERCDIEPQLNLINSPIISLEGNSLVKIKGLPTIKNESPLFTDLGVYLKYTTSNYIPSDAINVYEQEGPRFWNIPFIDKKDHDAPIITETSPVEGATYLTAPNMNIIIGDRTIFDRFRYINPVYNEKNELISNDGKEYYNNHIWASLDSGKTWVSLFKYTNKNLEDVFSNNPKYANGIGTGNKDLWIKAKDMQGNETIKKTQFRIGPTGLEDKILDPRYWVSFNPNTKTARLNYIENANTTHSIFNSAGGLVKTIQDNDGDGQTDIDFSNEPNGVYFDRETFGDGSQHTEKIVNY